MTTFRHPGTVLTDHTFAVPLDHARPDGERIEVFAREVVAAERAGDDLPWLLFLQGGPGHGSPRPIGRDSWLDRALTDFRVLLLDQRGTGRSTRITRQRLRARGNPQAQAEYLAHFRADAIVRDAELIRQRTAGRPWSVLGQSFGGFCAVTYLSFAPGGLRDVMITGGLPGLRATADDVYRATYPRVEARNDAHYARYPGDAELVRAVVGALGETDVSVTAFRSLGLALGSSTGSHELHYLVEDAFDAPGVLSDAFLAEVRHRLDLTAAPLYALLHEACYAQGGPTAWAAQRIRAEFPRFASDPALFTGEMIYPETIEPAFAEVAELLAAKDDWPALYDPARLRDNTVPVAAAVYYDDMYVDRELSEGTAKAISGARTWVTNEYEHDGLRVSRGAVLDRLIRMIRDEV
ncbi:alpha/beta fold hydrolase [Dactylosporangium sp. AC04546]|uniref:alpha/beta fold hydrolase n=1 Tax=Dactylosporangium sp. AC04546 TaxID=2862460 RepID=UPI001EDE64F9|nr:alpha/beta fold hydrolase [Dactylosporangium sp. AC04546]WVK78291.1 alpha/beta fold hydrolase [Dactylosporangium sp. AC04546]